MGIMANREDIDVFDELENQTFQHQIFTVYSEWKGLTSFMSNR